MIAVVGGVLAIPEPDGGAAGLAAEIAIAAAAGSPVELVCRLGDDPTGDAVLLALSRSGVGHAAILRDASRATPVVPPRDLAGEALDQEGAENDPGMGSAVVGGLELAPADLELALRYLTDLSVVVLADPGNPALVPVATEAAAYAGAALVIVGDPETAAAKAMPADATVLAPPEDGADAGAFAILVAEYAMALDGGKSPAEAWAAATKRINAERA